MIIGDDPKYLMQNNQGVVTLNIRRPSTFDGGKYTCVAINELGRDEVECKLNIRGWPPELLVLILDAIKRWRDKKKKPKHVDIEHAYGMRLLNSHEVRFNPVTCRLQLHRRHDFRAYR